MKPWRNPKWRNPKFTRTVFCCCSSFCCPRPRSSSQFRAAIVELCASALVGNFVFVRERVRAGRRRWLRSGRLWMLQQRLLLHWRKPNPRASAHYWGVRRTDIIRLMKKEPTSRCFGTRRRSSFFVPAASHSGLPLPFLSSPFCALIEL